MGQDADQLIAGRYRLIEVLGRGGMGAVWRARDVELDREVVVKQLTLPGRLDARQRDERYARMRREARAAARLKHPGIITVHDQILEDDGRPWIVMELIQGPSLADLLAAQGRLPVRQVAAIGAQMLAALLAAHAAGITHRDVKPANVLLEGGRVVLTDFGIAAIEGDLTITGAGAVLGTPAFMSPEQLGGHPATAASDLWALGATLYAAAEGRRPFDAPTPAALYAAIATRDPTPAAHAGPLTPVLLGLLHKDPARRLTGDQAMPQLTAIAAAQDTGPASQERVAGAAGTSPPPGAVPTTRPRQSRQPRRAAGAAVLLLLAAALIAAVTAASYPLWRGGDAEATRGTVTAVARLDGHGDTVESVAFSPDGKILASGGDGHTLRLWDTATRTPIGGPLTGHTSTIHSVAVSPDGKILASGSLDETIRLWDVRTRRPLGEPLTGHRDSVESVAFSPDGKLLASAGRDDTVRLWDVGTRRPVGEPLTGHTFQVYSVAFSPDGRLLASGGGDDTVRLWDVRTRQPVGGPLTGHTDYVRAVAFSPDGRLLASASNDNTVRLWDVAARRPSGGPLTGHSGFVSSVAFSRDGAALAAGDSTGRLWDVRTRRPIGDRLTGHTNSIYSVAFSPNGRLLATGSADHTIRLWDAAGLPARQPGRRPPWLAALAAGVAVALAVGAGALLISRRRPPAA